LFKEFNKYGEENPGCLHCNPIEQMLVEHDEGRNFVKGMEDSLEKKDKKGLVENARGYMNLIEEHIFKEDNILYPMADGTLSERTEEEMLIKFEKVARENKEEENKQLNFMEGFRNEKII